MASQERFVNTTTGITAPGSRAFAITTSDTGDFTADAGAFVTRALYIAVSGNIKVDMVGGSVAVPFLNVPVGILPFQVTRVYATDTTATGIVGID